jgi:hypothetical protein
MIRRDVIRMRSGNVLVISPIEDLNLETLPPEDFRFVNRMTRLAKASERNGFFVYAHLSTDPTEYPVLHLVFWDEIESIRPAFLDERGDEKR